MTNQKNKRMGADNFSFERGTLWSIIQERSTRAIKLGALHAIHTTSEIVQQNGFQFLVRLVNNFTRKDQAKREKDLKSFRKSTSLNPFLPYDEELFVSNISNSHVCLLNKFNVIDHHILIVTRAFEEQETFLTVGDFEAMWICMAEFDGLAFYNAGTIAGASQRHKHLQMVPVPLTPRGPKVPIEPALTSIIDHESVGRTPDLPFVHAICPVDPQWMDSPQLGAEKTRQCYHSMLEAVGLFNNETERPLTAYNLLISRRWMFLVPRSKECFDTISVNALGFAGALLVKNTEQMQMVKQTGPLNILQQVAVTP